MDFSLSHYYLEGQETFHSITAIGYAEAASIAKQLSCKSASKAYNRFRNFEWYYRQRRETENWLYRRFCEIGGQPQTQYPTYFVLGDNAYYESCFGQGFRCVHTTTASFNRSQMSVTIPDSMFSFLMLEEKNTDNFIAGYHGVVYDFSAVELLLDVQANWKRENKFVSPIEVQVWLDGDEIRKRLNMAHHTV